MLSSQALRCLYFRPLSGQLFFIQSSRAYSSRHAGDDETDLDAARQWFADFSKSYTNTIPASVAKTTFSRSSGPGGQKVNKTSSKATTVWPMSSLQPHLPKVLIPELQECRYYVRSSDSITIQSDMHRSQPDNTEDTHRKFEEEIKRLYHARVPGVTSASQKAKVDQFIRMHDFKKRDLSGNAAKARERLVQYRRVRGKNAARAAKLLEGFINALEKSAATRQRKRHP